MYSVIFDMDGTLLDTQRICIEAWEQSGARQGIGGLGDELPHVCGMNKAGWTAYLHARFPALDTDTFNAEVRRYVAENLEIRFRPGGEALLNFLSAKGVRLGLASGSSRATVSHHLRAVGAEHYFDAIVAGDEVARGKPQPDIFLRTAELLGAAPSTCFVVEDSGNGVKAGHAAGMRCIGIPDIVDFDAEVNELLFAKLERLDDAIAIFEKM